MTKQTSNPKTYVQDDIQNIMYKMIYKTLKMTKQTSNTKTYVQDDIQNIISTLRQKVKCFPCPRKSKVRGQKFANIKNNMY